MAAIWNFQFRFLPTFCIFSIFQMALPPFKAIFLQVILLRQQSYDIPDVRKSQGLQKMGWNISWCHLPERTPGPKMEGTFFRDGGSTKVAHFLRFSIFGTGLPPFKATLWHVILLRQQSYDIPDVRRSKGLQEMVWNIGWCHLPETSSGPKMGLTFFWDGGRSKI